MTTRRELLTGVGTVVGAGSGAIAALGAELDELGSPDPIRLGTHLDSGVTPNGDSTVIEPGRDGDVPVGAVVWLGAAVDESTDTPPDPAGLTLTNTTDETTTVRVGYRLSDRRWVGDRDTSSRLTVHFVSAGGDRLGRLRIPTTRDPTAQFTLGPGETAYASVRIDTTGASARPGDDLSGTLDVEAVQTSVRAES